MLVNNEASRYFIYFKLICPSKHFLIWISYSVGCHQVVGSVQSFDFLSDYLLKFNFFLIICNLFLFAYHSFVLVFKLFLFGSTSLYWFTSSFTFQGLRPQTCHSCYITLNLLKNLIILQYFIKFCRSPLLFSLLFSNRAILKLLFG